MNNIVSFEVLLKRRLISALSFMRRAIRDIYSNFVLLTGLDNK